MSRDSNLTKVNSDWDLITAPKLLNHGTLISQMQRKLKSLSIGWILRKSTIKFVSLKMLMDLVLWFPFCTEKEIPQPPSKSNLLVLSFLSPLLLTEEWEMVSLLLIKQFIKRKKEKKKRKMLIFLINKKEKSCYKKQTQSCLFILFFFFFF